MAWEQIAGALIGGMLDSDAASQAEQTQRDAAARAKETQLYIYDQNRVDQAPWRQVGMSALMRLAGGAGLATQAPKGYSPIGSSYAANDEDGLRGEIQRRIMASAPANNSTMVADGENSMSVREDPAYQQFLRNVPALVEQEFAREMAARNAAGEGRAFTGGPQVPDYVRGGTDGAPAGAGGSPVNDLTRRFTLADLQNDPVYQQSYQAGLDMGTKSLTASLGARGMLNSGGAAKAMARYASDYASQRGNEAFNRFQVGQGNERNFLSSLAGIGQQAVNQTQAANTNYGNNISALEMQAGNNAGAAQLAQGRIWGGAVQGIGNWYGQQSTLDRLNQQRNPGTSGNVYYANPNENTWTHYGDSF